MPWSSFEKLNKQRQLAQEPLFANPRNAAAGTLKSKSSSVVAKGIWMRFYTIYWETVFPILIIIIICKRQHNGALKSQKI